MPVVGGVLAQSRGEQIDNGSAQYAVSDNGTLVYVADLGLGDDRTMFHVDRQGNRVRLPQEPRPYSSPRFSPDGRLLAANVGNETGSDVWLIDLERGTESRITSTGSGLLPVISPDGQSVAYAATASGSPNANVFIGSVDDPATHRQLTSESYITMPMSFSPDGRSVAVIALRPGTGYDLGVVDVDGDSIEFLLATPASENYPTFSPDGRWIAFASDQTGRAEIYVMRTDGTAVRAVSTEGGAFPRWAPSGGELYWRNANRMMAATVETDADGFVHDPPHELFITSSNARGDFPMYDVDPRGGFLLLDVDGGPESAAFAQGVTMGFDFFSILDAPAGR